MPSASCGKWSEPPGNEGLSLFRTSSSVPLQPGRQRRRLAQLVKGAHHHHRLHLSRRHQDHRGVAVHLLQHQLSLHHQPLLWQALQYQRLQHPHSVLHQTRALHPHPLHCQLLVQHHQPLQHQTLHHQPQAQHHHLLALHLQCLHPQSLHRQRLHYQTLHHQPLLGHRRPHHHLISGHVMINVKQNHQLQKASRACRQSLTSYNGIPFHSGHSVERNLCTALFSSLGFRNGSGYTMKKRRMLFVASHVAER